MDVRQKTTLGNWTRFVARVAGLTGVLVATLGVALLAANLGKAQDRLFSADYFPAALNGERGEFAQRAALIAAAGAAVAVAVLVIELLSALAFGSGRRTAASTTATVSMVAGLAFLVFVNIYAFSHYERYDLTRKREFTIPPELAAELGGLRHSAPTTIVVFHKHKMFGSLSGDSNAYTKAAEDKVTEKVRDLVDQFREFGPQFKVVVLDTEAFDYEKRLADLTAGAPDLKTAIEAAPESSIFFYADKNVQRLAFNEFMQLDLSASKGTAGSENLVLIPQGADQFARRVIAAHEPRPPGRERFARRVLVIEERRPKVAILVVHELLTSHADHPENPYSLVGLRKSLTAQGFDVVDIVLKKNWHGAGELEPSADTYDESKLERLEVEADDAQSLVLSAEADLASMTEFRKRAAGLDKLTIPERVRFYNEVASTAVEREWVEIVTAILRWGPSRRPISAENEADFRAVFLGGLSAQTARTEEELRDAKKELAEIEARVKEARQNERLMQDRRMTDVAAKLSKQLADVDLLIIPRVTTRDAMRGPGVRVTLHSMSKEQVKAVKDFMRRGKPVLACLGPITPQVIPRQKESPEEFEKRLIEEVDKNADDFEKLIAERGVRLGRTVVLFDGETKNATRANLFDTRPFDVPPLALAEATPGSARKPNPIAQSVRLSARTAEKSLDLQYRALRPISVTPEAQARQQFAAEIAFTAPSSWNELRPYPLLVQRGDGSERPLYIPKYTPTPDGDPRKGTFDEERRGPFPVAVAVESPVPVAWLVEAPAVPAPARPQRIVVFGSGYLFVGEDLKPAQEKLLVHSVNWLTGREDRLPDPATEPPAEPPAEGDKPVASNPAWKYPRVAMTDRTRELWRLGTIAGLPLLVAFVGLIVTLRRRMR